MEGVLAFLGSFDAALDEVSQRFPADPCERGM